MKKWTRQQAKVYAAETDAQACMQAQGILQEFSTIKEMQKFTDKVVCSRWWKNQVDAGYCFRNKRKSYLFLYGVTIKKGRGRGAYAYYDNSITMPIKTKSYWNVFILLHELAHILIYHSAKSEPAGHGREFAKNHLALVKRFMGKGAWAILKGYYKAEGVKYITRKA